MRNITILTLLSLLFCSMSYAQYDCRFDYSVNGSSLEGQLTLLTCSTAQVGRDSGDQWATIDDKEANCGIYKQNGKDGWDSNPGLLSRENLPSLGASQTLLIPGIYVWAGTLAPRQDIQLVQTAQPRLAQGMSYTLMLVQIPVGIQYMGKTQWTADVSSITLPFFATDDFTKGYRFQAIITAPQPVPEPSSLLALFSGLATVGSMLCRRRK